MKATLDKIKSSRSLQRRWALTDAESVRSFLPPCAEFVPADLRIWWSAGAGQTPDQHSLHIYAWPAERELTVSAHWTTGYNHHPMPGWIRELADIVHDDLIANATTTNAGAEDAWDYSISRRWTVQGADPVRSLRHPDEPFVPRELSIWNTFNPNQPNHNRYRITGFPDGRYRQPLSSDWDGGSDLDGSPRYNKDLPEWIRELAKEQHDQLAAFAALSESERRKR